MNEKRKGKRRPCNNVLNLNMQYNAINKYAGENLFWLRNTCMNLRLYVSVDS